MKISRQLFLKKEWHSKETRLLLAALTIAISMLSMLGFYTDRVQRSIDQHAAEFLGGDLVIKSPDALPENWQQQARAAGCKTAAAVLFPSMVNYGSQLHLANIKAVSAGYPLYGHLRISRQNEPVNSPPPPGTVWINQQFLKLLGIKLNAPIQIGSASLKATHLLLAEPDASPFGLTIAPRILMNAQDLPATKIIQPGSRVEYRLYIAGENANIAQFKRWLKPQLRKNQKLTTIRQDSGELANTLQKADAFLHIAAFVCVLLAGIAIATTSRYFLQRQINSIALLRCFGLTYQNILLIFSSYLFVLALIGSLMGAGLGYLLQLGLASILAQWLQFTLAQTNLWPLLPSVLFGYLILFGFSLPALLNLKQIPPAWILRKQTLNLKTKPLLLLIISAFILALLLGWQSHDLKLTAIVLAGFAAAGSILYAAAWLLLRALLPFRQGVGIFWRYGLNNLTRRTSSSIIQIMSFGFIFMAALLLTLIRTDLINSWETQIPKQAPNFFAINIQPNEVSAFQQALQQLSLKTSALYPMVRGRLIMLNQQPIMRAVPPAARNNNALKRELNLSWTTMLPTSNQLTAGSWWQAIDQGKALVSVEQELAENLGIKLGDKLAFQIGDQTIEATVHSLRHVEWYSFQPNFFMIFPKGVLDKFPTTYITSFLVPKHQRLALTAINQKFSNVTLIDVAQILEELQSIIAQITLASNYLLAFILIASIIVLYASSLTSYDERLYECAILRSLGASRKHLFSSLLIEFAAIGFLAGIIAAICAAVIAVLLANTVFKIPPQINVWWYALTPLASTLTISILGLLGTYKTATVSPLSVIKEI